MNLDSIYLSKSIGLLNPKPPKIVTEDVTVAQVISILKDDSGGAVLVCNSEDKLVGVFTERDVLKKIVGVPQALDQNILIYMTKNPVAVNMTTPLAHALQLMSEGGFRHVPVTDEKGTALAVLSMKDIVDELVRAFVLKD